MKAGKTIRLILTTIQFSYKVMKVQSFTNANNVVSIYNSVKYKYSCCHWTVQIKTWFLYIPSATLTLNLSLFMKRCCLSKTIIVLCNAFTVLFSVMWRNLWQTWKCHILRCLTFTLVYQEHLGECVFAFEPPCTSEGAFYTHTSSSRSCCTSLHQRLLLTTLSYVL